MTVKLLHLSVGKPSGRQVEQGAASAAFPSGKQGVRAILHYIRGDPCLSFVASQICSPGPNRHALAAGL